MLLLSLICFAALAIQLIYLILFFVAFVRRRKNIPVEPHAVSVIVCAHDEELNLRELVPLLLKQNHPQFEVIVVEDRCNDETYDYL
ncbi:MAG: glycosyltransferase, partial [Cyclobacteriaceae bacterium]|nr:glycosyltransferase [Cyclobacteriaceae bacterium]